MKAEREIPLFGQFSEKVVGDHEIIKLTSNFCFGKRYDVSKHISNTKNSSRRTPRRNFDNKMMKIQKKSRK